MQPGFLLMLVGAALIAAPRARSAGVLATIAAGLALAALRAVASPPALPAGFVSADAALVAIAVLLAAVAVLRVVRSDPTAQSLGGAGAIAAGAVVLAWGGRQLAPAVPPASLAAALAVIAGAGTLLVLVGRRIRLPPPPERLRAAPLTGVAGLLGGALAVAAGPHLALVFAGVIAAGWSGWLLQRAAGGSKVPLAPVLTLLLLPAYWLMATIAGPEGLGMVDLADLPISPAAGRLLTPALLLAAWALSGLWPLHRQQPGPLTAAVGVVLLARVVLPVMPEGIGHWRALVMPVVVLGLWHAALSGRWSLIAVAMAWVGAIAPARGGPAGAGLLLAGALILDLAERRGAVHRGRATLARIAGGTAVGWGALSAVESGLGGEVVYTVLAVAGLVAAVGRWTGARAPGLR